MHRRTEPSRKFEFYQFLNGEDPLGMNGAMRLIRAGSAIKLDNLIAQRGAFGVRKNVRANLPAPHYSMGHIQRL